MAADRRPVVFACCIVLLVVLSATSAGAHSQSSSRLFLDLSPSGTQSLAIELALVDLSQALALDADGDGALTWGEVRSSRAAIAARVMAGVQIRRGDGRCSLRPSKQEYAIVERTGVPYLRMRFDLACAPGAGAEVYGLRYSLFFEANPAHRALLRVTGAAREGAHVLSPADDEVRLAPGRSAVPAAAGFALQGIHHILSGYDHLVFVALLILPAAGSGALRHQLIRIGLIVTAFTVAHSLTLAASVSGLVRLPARPVEIGIAASIVLAGVINVVRPSHSMSWQVAFAFGLLHGFGFAGALQEMTLERGILLPSLLGFNLGVELGQVLVVALILPFLVLVSHSARYRSVVIPVVSLAGAAIGVTWTAARF